MKKNIYILIPTLIIIFVIALVALFKIKNSSVKFYAHVEEVGRKYILIVPNDGQDVKKSSDKIVVDVEDSSAYKIGDEIIIQYNGMIMETYPAKINAEKIEILK